MKKISLFLFSIFSFSTIAFSQVGINTVTPASNTDLTLGSTDKGFLPNKVALVSTTSVAPLTGTVTEGTIVYNTTDNGVLGTGLFYWTGSQWIRFTTTTAKQQDSRLLTFKKTGDVTGTDEVKLGYLTETQINAGSIGTEIPSLASSFSVDKAGTIFVMSVLYAKLTITGNLNYAYVGNTFFRVRVTNTSDNTYSDFIAGCSPASTTQSGSSASGGDAAKVISANNNPAVAVAQGSLAVEPNINYSVKVYGLEGWVSTAQGYVTSGTYMWRTFKLYSTLKIDFVSVAY